MKMVARSYVWWPSIDKDINNYVDSCLICQQSQNVKKEVVTSTWPQTDFPFQRIHVDFFHLWGKTFLLLVDTYSKFCDVQIMSSTNAHAVIEKLRGIFVIFGLPTEIVADNGPPFGSLEFANFCLKYDIKLTNSPPYHPQSNGSAERNVQTTKKVFKKFCLGTEKSLSLQARVDKFLIHQRNVPSTVTNKTPSEMLFCFKPKIALDLLNPKIKVKFDLSKNEVNEIPSRVKKFKNKKMNWKNDQKFKEEEKVMYRNHFKTDVSWIPATVLKKVSANTDSINVHNKVRLVHVNQLRVSRLADKCHPGMYVSARMGVDDFIHAPNSSTSIDTNNRNAKIKSKSSITNPVVKDRSMKLSNADSQAIPSRRTRLPTDFLIYKNK